MPPCGTPNATGIAMFDFSLSTATNSDHDLLDKIAARR